MKKLALSYMLSLALCTTVRAETTTTTTTSCPLQDEINNLPPSLAVEINQAVGSAAISFNQDPATSKANEAFATAMESFPASVTSSLRCSGYGGIDINSLPTWLSAVPTSYVSMVLQEQSVYESIITSIAAEASTSGTVTTGLLSSSSTSPAMEATASAPSTTSATSKTTASSTGQQASPSPSSSSAIRSFVFDKGMLAMVCLVLVLGL